MGKPANTSQSSARNKALAYSWRLPDNTSAITDLAELREVLFAAYHVPPLYQLAYAKPDYREQLHVPGILGGINAATRRIQQAIEADEKIAIYGDYDIDGITATAVLLDVLTKLGAAVEPYIPDRFEEGYGLNSAALKQLKSAGVGLVISVDCGISAAKEVSQAKADGLEIIITDHHSVPAMIPTDAVACINPRLLGDKYPFKELAGVGVAFKLACVLAAQYPKVIAPGMEKWLLDLVALGTVCDVVPLTGENRALVQFGLTVLRKSPRPGLHALAAVSGTELSEIVASDLGFRFGPRLNAAGRLEHAAKALELLTTTDRARADELAQGLNELNRQRQADTTRIFEEANVQAQAYSSDPILVLQSPDWSHGVVGLVASRISEAWHKPTILLQQLDEVSKGSARSVGGFNIIQAITASADVLSRFGGHAFAAGMTLKSSRVDQLRQQLIAYAKAHVDELSSEKELAVTAVLSPGLLSLKTAEALTDFEPYGNGNPQPVFTSQLTLTKLRPVGSDLSHFQMSFTTEAGEIGAIAFGGASKWPWLQLGQKVEVAFRLGINSWQGNERVQLEVADIRPIS